MLPPSWAQRFMETLPDSRLEWVEECGHFSHLEQPQALADALARFLGREGGWEEGVEREEADATAVA